jgi:hypothetical protein
MQTAKGIIAGSKDFERLESGIVVPPSVAEEKRDTERKTIRWTVDVMKRWRRLNAELARDRVVLIPMCFDCKKTIALVALSGEEVVETHTDKLIDKVAYRCDCTDRLIVRGV